jgi:serine/threonine protein kinase
MSPEQAKGRIAAIDQRSDVYALGAILYEILALAPPVDMTGDDPFEILRRVIQGQIPPPHLRAPERARQGKIPRELAAIAMKALANDPQQRYQTVGFLRRDIELYQEGRSVSAKEDSRWELNLHGCGKIDDVSALRGVKLTNLSLRLCSVSDLGPLEGMPLTFLDIGGCTKVIDLRPLKGMKLAELGFWPKHIKAGMEVLREMRTLKSIFLEHAPRYVLAAVRRGEFRP